MELPKPVNLKYITQLNPPQQAAAAVAQTLNDLLLFLQEYRSALDSLKAFAKPIDELLEHRLGPHPYDDPDFKGLSTDR